MSARPSPDRGNTPHRGPSTSTCVNSAKDHPIPLVKNERADEKNPESAGCLRRQSAWAKLPHALIDDVGLSVDARALLIYRLARSPSWALHWKDTGRRFGWSKSRCYGAITELTKKGYLERRQARPHGGRWGRAKETLNLERLQGGGRQGFQLLPRAIVDDVRLRASELLALALMRSHAATRAFYARDLAQALGCHRQTALKVWPELHHAQLRGEAPAALGQRKIAGCVYRLTEQGNKKVAKWAGAKRGKRRHGIRKRRTLTKYRPLRKDQSNEGRTRTTYALQGKALEAGAFPWIGPGARASIPISRAILKMCRRRKSTIPSMQYPMLNFCSQVLAAARDDCTGACSCPRASPPVRIFLAAGATLDEVLDIIARRIGQKKGKFINGWGVIAAAVASDILLLRSGCS